MSHLLPYLKPLEHLKYATLIPLLALLLLLAGCAETKYVMRFDPASNSATPSSAQVWPGAPETPRFRYAGTLLGEENFVPDDQAEKRGAAVRLLRWLVGLTRNAEEKIELRRPQSGMVDDVGRVYVTDVSNHAVFVFDEAAGKLSIWDKAEEHVSFVTPIGIVEGAGGHILVADAELGRVYRLGRDGRPLGSFGKGILNRPTGLARDAQRGRLFVADTHAHDIKIFDDEGNLVDVIGQRGEEDGDLNFPTHLAFANDKLYVTDGMNARVQIFDSDGKSVGGFGRRGLYIGNMTRPKGISVDTAGNIYVVESFYDTLLIFDNQGNFLMPIGGTGKEIGQFYLPSGVWNDRKGRIYVADMFNGRVVIFQFLGGG